MTVILWLNEYLTVSTMPDPVQGTRDWWRIRDGPWLQENDNLVRMDLCLQSSPMAENREENAWEVIISRGISQPAFVVSGDGLGYLTRQLLHCTVLPPVRPWALRPPLWSSFPAPASWASSGRDGGWGTGPPDLGVDSLFPGWDWQLGEGIPSPLSAWLTASLVKVNE